MRKVIDTRATATKRSAPSTTMRRESRSRSTRHRGATNAAGRGTSPSRCLPRAACRLGPMTTSVAVAMAVFVLVSTIDGSFATVATTTTTTTSTTAASTCGSPTRTTHDRRGWNIAGAVRGGSMTTVQQQEQQLQQQQQQQQLSPPPPPLPPPPRQDAARDDRDRRYQESVNKLQLQEKSPHEVQVHQQHRQHWNQQDQQYATYGDNYRSRGYHSRMEQEDLSSILPRKIDLKQVTKVLLHTSETNQKLLRGVSHWEKKNRNQLVKTTSSSASSTSRRYSEPSETIYRDHAGGDHRHHPNPDGVYGSLPVNVHPSRTWQPSVREFSGRTFEDEELTLFHAKIPRSRSSSDAAEGSDGATTNNADTDDASVRSDAKTVDGDGDVDGDVEPLGAGARYWGPDLLPYLEHILYDLLGIEKEGSEILLVLSIIYLDRACSVDTPRTNQHQYQYFGGSGAAVPHCPFCNPRTVHRLSLSALVVATKAYRRMQTGIDRDDDAVVLSKLARSLGIPLIQLRQMVEWMLLALGDNGLHVSMEELRGWTRSWESFFPPEEEEEKHTD